ncbi:phosphocarrier protein [Hypnocyclicus thermotrophus]|uniref:Phosphocarrier protein n=1 Tax=Hypnocyclicus thermotrophus TaxID=1627895 RepID=A0AA46I5C9_9FUSO|nr:HPr family phosphocarrier protein [Hypnocyclicus thermotrophus]TDT69823.1 phosphocarrier protein [Hypnocyclicus thermotrophus]
MKELEVEIKNEAGLHARPSSLFVQIAGEYDADVTVISDGEEVNGKSIMGLMLLAAEKGRKLKLIADGPDEDEVLQALQKLIEVDKFNED